MRVIGNRGKYGETVKKITEGVLETITDTVLFTIFVTAESSFNHMTKAFAQADEDLKRFNYRVLRRAVTKLKMRGYLNSAGEVTALGRGKVERLVPEIFVPVSRAVGELFLIIYDVKIGRAHV